MTTITGKLTNAVNAEPLVGTWTIKANHPIINQSTSPDSLIMPVEATVAVTDGTFSFDLYPTDDIGISYHFKFEQTNAAEPAYEFDAVVPDLPDPIDLIDLLPAGVPREQLSTTIRLLRNLVAQSIGSATDTNPGLILVDVPDSPGPSVVYTKNQIDAKLTGIPNNFQELDDVAVETISDGDYIYYDQTDGLFKGGSGGAGGVEATTTTAGIVKINLPEPDPVVYTKSSADSVFALKGNNTDITGLDTVSIDNVDVQTSITVPVPGQSNQAANKMYVDSTATNAGLTQVLSFVNSHLPRINQFRLCTGTTYTNQFYFGQTFTELHWRVVPSNNLLMGTQAYAAAPDTTHGSIALWDTTSSSWILRRTTHKVITTLGSGSRLYDVYARFNGTDVELVTEISAVTGNSLYNARTLTTVTQKDGVWVKTSDPTMRYLGCYYLSANGSLVGSSNVWNVDNQVRTVYNSQQGADFIYNNTSIGWYQPTIGWINGPTNVANQIAEVRTSGAGYGLIYHTTLATFTAYNYLGLYASNATYTPQAYGFQGYSGQSANINYALPVLSWRGYITNQVATWAYGISTSTVGNYQVNLTVCYLRTLRCG